MSTKKSWRDKLAGYPLLPNVKEIPLPMRKRHGEGTIATPSPREVEDAMRGVPEAGSPPCSASAKTSRRAIAPPSVAR